MQRVKLTDSILFDRLKQKYPDQEFPREEFRGDLTVTVPIDRLLDFFRFLRDDEELDFQFLVDLTCIDNLDRDRSPRFDLIYLLHSFKLGYRFRIRVAVPDDWTERVPSLTDLWPAADFMEREVYDLFGLGFSGHPNLKRLLMPSWTEGHPLRKDYPLEGMGEREVFDSEPE